MPQDQRHVGCGGGGKARHSEGDAFDNPLPEGTRESVLGPVRDWPETLQAFSLTAAAFAFPSAVFYGQEFSIFHNHAWADVVGVEEQGQAQRGRLSPDAWDALSCALNGGQPKRIEAKQLLGNGGSGTRSSTAYKPVLLSPLFDPQSDKAVGVLAQLVPEAFTNTDPAMNTDNKRKENPLGTRDGNAISPRHRLDISKLGSVVDEFPLDEHPFFHRFAEMLPSGLAILDHRAQAVFVNQVFYQLTTHRQDDKAFKSWPQSIHPEDYDRVMNLYQDAFTSQKQLRTEFRAVVEDNHWRLLLLTPLGDENLRHVSLREYGGFICSIVDISSEKSAELSERKAAKEARERKEQQERFIDMISHEIRNPLSAILHCTEDIEEAVEKESDIDLKAIHEAVETIQLCISHQRNIVDDVLSFSKLDASMLSLTPKSCQPSAQIAQCLKMFAPEFRKQSMKFEYCLDYSYIENDLNFAMADMARIGQIVVNLTSNAIKFTAKKRGERNITVSVGASIERPTSYPAKVVYFDADDLASRLDATGTAAWGNGQPVYVMVAVNDTGIGISEEGQRQLFERFRQATPKTSSEYGGSGLGLNISRKMCHLHGGEIGVSSKEGFGSTFGFFFKVKRATPPEQDSQTQSENQELDSEVLKSQVRALGNITGSARDDEDETPASIKSPPVVDADDAAPHPDGSTDERYQKTKRVASHVKEPKADDYANAARSKISEQHRSGTHLKSSELIQQSSGKDERSSQSSDEDQTSGTRLHVLLVEDNVINQRIVFRKLDAKGYNVTTANNGREAVNAIREAPLASTGDRNAVTIILMDSEMPVLDGNSATKEIRDLEKEGVIERIPILGLTANVRGAQLQEMLDSGMDDVLSKPYKIEDLVTKIEEMTGGKQKG